MHNINMLSHRSSPPTEKSKGPLGMDKYLVGRVLVDKKEGKDQVGLNIHPIKSEVKADDHGVGGNQIGLNASFINEVQKDQIGINVPGATLAFVINLPFVKGNIAKGFRWLMHGHLKLLVGAVDVLLRLPIIIPGFNKVGGNQKGITVALSNSVGQDQVGLNIGGKNSVGGDQTGINLSFSSNVVQGNQDWINVGLTSNQTYGNQTGISVSLGGHFVDGDQVGVILAGIGSTVRGDHVGIVANLLVNTVSERQMAIAFGGDHRARKGQFGLYFDWFNEVGTDECRADQKVISVSVFGNGVLGNQTGATVSGFGNRVDGNQKGFHAAGVFNTVTGMVKGFSFGGLLNHVNNVKGAIVGILATVDQTLKGFAVGIFCVAHQLKGVMIGVVTEVTDTDNSKGVQIGLVNIKHTEKGRQYWPIIAISRGRKE